MATLYLKTAGGNWNAAATWSNVSSAGVDNSGPPAAGDNVILELGSGNLTINAAAACRSLDCTSGTGSYAGTVTHNSGITLSIGDATVGAGSVALKLVAGMTYTLGSASTSAISFVSTSATQQTVAAAGKTCGNLTFNGAGGSWLFSDGVSNGSTATVTVTTGTFNTGGQTCSWGSLVRNGSAATTWTFGASAITLTAANGGLSSGSAAGLTVTANTATITMTGNNCGFTHNASTAINWNGLSLVFSGSGTQILGSNMPNGTINGLANLTANGAAAKTGIFSVSNPVGTITGQLLFVGNSVTNRLTVQSNIVGTTRTFTVNGSHGAHANVNFFDITIAGSAGTLTGTSIGDCQGNSGITFDASVAQSQSIASSFTWSTAAWTTRVPLPQDDCTITGNGAGKTITMDMPYSGRTNDLSAVTGTPTFTPSVGWWVFGNLTLGNAITWTSNSNTVTLADRRGGSTVTSGGNTIQEPITIAAPGGDYTPADNLTGIAARNFTLSNGTFSDGGHNVTCGTFISTGTATRSLTMSGTWTLNGTGAITIWNLTSTGLTFSGANSTIAITSTDNLAKNFTGLGYNYGSLTYTGAGTGALQIFGSNVWTGNITFIKTAACSIIFEGTQLQSVTGTATFQGAAGQLLTIDTTNPGSVTTILAGAIVESFDSPTADVQLITAGVGAVTQQ